VYLQPRSVGSFWLTSVCPSDDVATRSRATCSNAGVMVGIPHGRFPVGVCGQSNITGISVCRVFGLR
jgi:hypothetical protein